MAVNIITSGFLLLVLAAGVQSAIKDLGDVCTDVTDTCVTPGLDLVCDTPKANANGHCRVKATKACNEAGGLCVLGATCVSNVCTCQGSYTNATSGKCTPVATGYGATCTTSSAASDCGLTGTANLHTSACGDDSECKCTDATFGPAFNGKCATITTQKVGFTCSTSTATDCVPGSGASTNLVCDATTTKCTCAAGFFAKSVGGDCATGSGTIGKACPTGNGDCTAANNEVCTSSKCACATNYIGQAGGKCFPAKGKLKGGCLADSDCGSGFKCNMTCKTEVAAGGNCTDTTSTVCATSLTCNDNKCKTELPLSGNCTDTAKTFCGAGLGCNANICTQSNANSVTITALLVMAVAAVGKLMM